MKYLIGILILLFTNVNIVSQAPDMKWFRAQGTDTEEHVHEGMQTSDSGFIAIGHGIEKSDSDDMLIIKTDYRGTLEWIAEFGTHNKRGTGYCIIETIDGYIAGGAIFHDDSNRTQRFLVKLDFYGNTLWQKYYGSIGVGGIRGIDEMDDGGFVITGYKNTPSTSEFSGFVFIVDDGEGFIMKIDNNGNTLWEKSIDAPQGTKVRRIEDGYAISSCVWEWNQSNGDHQDFCLFKLDNEGNTIWRKVYGGESHDHLYDFDVSADGGFILGGHTLSYGVENWDYLLIKVDSEGVEQWYQTYGQPRGYDAAYIHDESYGVRQTPDGGYIICGGSGDEYSYSASGHYSGPSDEWKVYLVRTDSKGNIIWEGVYPTWSTGNNAGEYIGLTNDGGYIVFVDTDSQTYPAPNNYGFMKIAQDEITDLRTEDVKPHEFYLHQNYPNPFNPSTVIRYTIPLNVIPKSKNDVETLHAASLQTINVELEIYDILGREITTLVNQKQNPGVYEMEWNPSADGADLPGGVYFYKLTFGDRIETKKMVFIK